MLVHLLWCKHIFNHETEDCFYVFDAHSRNEYGQQSGNGISVLLKLSSLHALILHCFKLAKSLGVKSEQFY